MKTLLLILSVCTVCSVKATNYYFSNVSGDDSRTSIQAQNPSTPWKTLNKLNPFISGLIPGDSVLLKRGETFSGGITISISGSISLPIVFGAYGSGAKPVITGFTTIKAWAPLGNNIYESYNAAFKNVVNMVTINGVQQAPGRYPNINTNKGYLTFETHGVNSITDNELTSTIDWTAGEVVIKPKRWILDRRIITSHAGSKLSFSPALTYDPYDNYGYFIQNNIKTLDLPGEWFYDPSTKKMNVFSIPVKFKASTVEILVSVRNQNNIVFDNLVFTGSNSKAFDLYYAQNIKIKNCDILFCGIDGIFGSSTTNLSIENNTITNTNNNAINLSYNCNNTVLKNNVIKRTGLFAGLGTSGNNNYQAITINGKNNLIEYNNIDSTGFTAVRFASGDSNIIKNNFINNFTLTKDDGGGINSGGTSGVTFNGIKITGNIILNGIGISEGTDRPGTSSSSGIYMDDNMSNALIEGNTVSNCGKSGILIHNAFKMSLAKNTLYNNVTQLVMAHDYAMPDALLRDNIINNNILFSKLTTQAVSDISTMADDIHLLGVIDSNYYCRPFDDNLVTKASYVNTSGLRVDQLLDLPSWQAAYKLDKSSNKTPVQIPAFTTTTSGANKFSNGNFNTNNSGSYSSSISTWVSNKLDGGTFQASNLSSGNNNYFVIMEVGAIDHAKNYLLKFSSQSARDTILKVYLRSSGAPYNQLSDTKVFKITTTRKENEFLFTLPAGISSASIVFETKCPLLTFWLDNMELNEANSVMTNPEDYILFEYNASQVSKTISLQGDYIDVKNNAYSNSVVLAPYASIVLIKQDAPLGLIPLGDLDFTGKELKNINDLKWETSFTKNTKYFEVERASNGFAFRPIGKVQANSNGLIKGKYNFSDNAPGKSINYYRLKQFDVNGKFTYSKVIHFQNSGGVCLSIFPSPARKTVSIQLNGLPGNKEMNVYILSAAGSVVKVIHANTSSPVLLLDVSKFKAGIYMVKAVSGGVTVSKEFLKL